MGEGGAMTDESGEARIKRLRMRAWRRGTKEMDIVLGPYADAHLGGMDAAALGAFDALLLENDQDLAAWITGQMPAPEAHGALVARIAAYAHSRHRSAREGQ